jgi:transmembrane sensor
MKSNQDIGGVEEEAASAFIQRVHGEWTQADQARLEGRLATDTAYASAYQRVECSWGALGRYAETPELMRYREEALAFARRTNVRRWIQPAPMTRARWLAAAAAGLGALTLAVTFQLSPYAIHPGEYRTGIAEQRTVELADHSRVALDAATRIQVRFSKDARIVELKYGQAEFSVSHDLTRPFKVQVGGETIVALGTVFNVEYVDRQVRVAMMEGRVAVVSSQPSAQWRRGLAEQPDRGSHLNTQSDALQSTLNVAAGTDAIELAAGEGVRIGESGAFTVTPKADLEAVTAWRAGKVIFRAETIAAAVRRVNRYSQLQIEVDDPQLAARQISGVFEAGDTQGFATALQKYLPISLEYAGTKIRVKAR